MQALFDTWWFGGMIVPLIVSILTGAVASLVVSRYMMFYQEIRRATDETMTLLDRFKAMTDATDRGEALDKIQWLLLKPAMALNSQGHWTASIILKQYGIDLERGCEALRARFHAEIVQTGGNLAAINAVVDRAVSDAGRLMLEGVDEIAKLRPDPLTVLFGISFSRFAGRWIVKAVKAYRRLIRRSAAAANSPGGAISGRRG
jgi:hypothetical protein